MKLGSSVSAAGDAEHSRSRREKPQESSACGIDPATRRMEARTGLRMNRKAALAIAWMAALALAACHHQSAPGSEASADHTQFPVATPFPLDREGATATVEFTLPNTRDGGALRPVFIGFQRLGKAGKMTDAEVEAASREADRLATASIPLRVQLEPVGAATAGSHPVLQEMQPQRGADGKYAYLPLQGDVATVHMPTGEDSGEMLRAGLHDSGTFYLTHEIARIVPPAPGRYRLKVRNLEDQPALRGLPFRLIVSHYQARGIQ